MHLFNNPSWIDRRLLKDTPPDQVPESLFDEINAGLLALQKDTAPSVSVVIPLLNEERCILRTLFTLSKNSSDYSVEVVVVNNNSTDRTQEILDKLCVRSVFQPKPGWGPARQMGQEHARGKYVLMADADCFYPPRWIQRMASELDHRKVTCVYGDYKFLASEGKSRLDYSLYELMRNVIAEVRNLRRPWFNCRGMNMGYIKTLGLRVGFVDRKIRGEDGRMCYELAQLGRIHRIRSRDVIVWTFPRTLQQDGSLFKSFISRALVEMARFGSYFRKEVAHDTHTSKNFQARTVKYIKRINIKDPAEQKETIE